ncbi:MAG TPA: hypothetical protein VFT93_08315, partial [Candidatus Eisenbacteria bacterium]|nr:hypothetical protein [Candidatus Eisenbacteria bacterium]
MHHRHLKVLGGAAILALALIAIGYPDSARAGLQFRSLPDPAEYLYPLDDTPAGLPRSWRFPTPGPAQNGFGDPTVSISVDPITGLVRENYLEQNVDIREPFVVSEPDYNRVLTARTTRRLWQDTFRQNRSIQRTDARVGGGMFRLALPVVLPKAVRSIVGDGAPNLEVTGSEQITLSGTSDWTANKTNNNYTGERTRQGAFPSFEMKQELNVNLTGSIGDKIKVDVDQSSNVQTSLDNKVKLRYEGDEDDMIKSVELGNTNLSLQGASIRQEGLFGVKTAAKLGNVDVVTIASKQEGKNETARFTPSGDKTQVIIRDVDYIKRQYFSLTDHFALIDYKGEKAGQRLEVYKLDLSTNKLGLTQGIGRVNPNAPYDSLTNPETRGYWKLLTNLTDYTVEEDHWQGLPNGLRVPVIRLTVPLSEPEVLGVVYTETTNGVTNVVGIGADLRGPENVPLGKPADWVLLKVIKFAGNEIDVDPEGRYLSTDPWFPTLKYELRNFYDLGARNISTTTMTLNVRRRQEGQAINPDQIGGKPLIAVLGLDQKDISGELGAPDGKVDLNLVDAERGILFFPDLNPFAPFLGDSAACGPDSFPLACLNNVRYDPEHPRPVSNTLSADS